jgi:hypothetical protein
MPVIPALGRLRQEELGQPSNNNSKKAKKQKGVRVGKYRQV